MERFYQIFTEYQLNLSKGLNTLASQIQVTKELSDNHTQNITSTYLKVSEIETSMSFNLSQINKEIESIKIHLKNSGHTYPFQGLKDAINSAERKIQQTADETNEEIVISFDKSIKLMEDACSAIISVMEPLKTNTDNMRKEAQSNLKMQVTMIKEIYEKIANIHSNLVRVEKTTKTQEEKINLLIEQSNRNENILSSLSQTSERHPKAHNPQLKPPNPPLGKLSLNMIHIKKFGNNLKTKYLESKPQMDWNKFGDGEWQIIEQAIRNQTLPPVRYKDLFREGENPKGKNDEMTKWGNLVTVDQICQKFDVFNETWINMRPNQGYKFLSHGLFQCRIQGLHSPDPEIRICDILVDERISDFKKCIIGLGQSEF